MDTFLCPDPYCTYPSFPVLDTYGCIFFCVCRCSPSLAAAAEAEARRDNGGSDTAIAAAGAGGGRGNGEVDAAAAAAGSVTGRLHESMGSQDSAAATRVARTATAQPRRAGGSVVRAPEPAAASTFHGLRASASSQHAVVVLATAGTKTNQSGGNEPTGNSKGGAAFIRGRTRSSGSFTETISAALFAAVSASMSDAGSGSGSDSDSDKAPLPSSNDGGRPVDQHRPQCVAAAAVAAAAARPPRARNAAAAGSAFWRQTTGSLDRVHDSLFRFDLQAYKRTQEERRFQPRSNGCHTMGRAKESTAPAAAPGAATKPRGGQATATPGVSSAAALGNKNLAAEETKAQSGLPPSAWVVQHIDKSKRHGVAFLMSDGSVVIRFRDDTLMVSEPMPMSAQEGGEDRGAVEYYVKGGKGKSSPSPPRFIPIPEGDETEAAEQQEGGMTTSAAGGGRGGPHRDLEKEKRSQHGQRRKQQPQINRTRFTMQSVPPHLEKKASILATFRRRLLVLAAKEDADRAGGSGGVDKKIRGEEKSGGDGGSRATPPWEPSVLVEAYRPTRHSFLFVLSGSTVQVRWADNGDPGLLGFSVHPRAATRAVLLVSDSSERTYHVYPRDREEVNCENRRSTGVPYTVVLNIPNYIIYYSLTNAAGCIQWPPLRRYRVYVCVRMTMTDQCRPPPSCLRRPDDVHRQIHSFARGRQRPRDLRPPRRAAAAGDALLRHGAQG